jgi:hypothetical protein
MFEQPQKRKKGTYQGNKREPSVLPLFLIRSNHIISFLSVAEEAFLLRKFVDALSLSYQALSKIAENTTRAFYYYDQKSPVVSEKGYIYPIFTNVQDEPFINEKSSKFRSTISKLNSLYHECSGIFN